MIIRLKANPVLLNILKSKPDIFIYGEAQIASTINLNIVGYSHYFHRSKFIMLTISAVALPFSF